ncbi:acyl-CoA desaturase [Cellvibrio mixtus]|uniref:acyl-CoA desaturase n=1 Tax=Cellvibrio mixtus TaxID=39650 RepID=UPI000694EF60|nr:acyl-CoA desaturase [Cellvibrio mixtus]
MNTKLSDPIQSVPETAFENPREKRVVRVTLNDPDVIFAQKILASATIVLPFLGVIAAIYLMVVDGGVSALNVGLLIGMYILTNLGIEMGYHRLLAHRSFQTSSFLKYLLTILGQMAGEGGVIYWVATHRRHHIHSDTELDPHSPHVRHTHANPENLGLAKGLLHAHLGWMINDKVTNSSAFAKDLIQDSTLKKINDLYVPILILGLIIPGVIGGLATQTWMGALTGFIWGGLVRMFLVTQSTWLNGSFAHRYGSKPYETGDHSANNMWCALPTFGASWQNNHHAYPTAAKLGFKWWQVDIAWYFIFVCKKIGLVWNVKHVVLSSLKPRQ